MTVADVVDGARRAQAVIDDWTDRTRELTTASPRNGLPFTLSLGCGTWGGTITTENINARHFVNLTWVSRPIPPRVIDVDALFADHIRRYGP